jgi:hypothetical protein
MAAFGRKRGIFGPVMKTLIFSLKPLKDMITFYKCPSIPPEKAEIAASNRAAMRQKGSNLVDIHR